jgi:hypothetical protein
MKTTKRAMISVVVSTLIVLLSAISARAALIMSSSRAMFDDAAPGLPVETFASGTPTTELVPESSTLLLVGIGLLAAAMAGRRYYRVRSKRSESR